MTLACKSSNQEQLQWHSNSFCMTIFYSVHLIQPFCNKGIHEFSHAFLPKWLVTALLIQIPVIFQGLSLRKSFCQQSLIASVLSVPIPWNLFLVKTSRLLLLLLLCRNTFTPAIFSPILFSPPVLCFGTYSCSQMAPWMFTGPAGVVGQKIHCWYLLHINQGHYTTYSSCLLTFFLNGREADKAARRGLTKSQVNCVIQLRKKKPQLT